MDKPTEKTFLLDVKEHRLQIIRDDGLYRHLRFKKDLSSTMYFDIVTWPLYIVFTGDMGTYCFGKTEDMFCFFRDIYRSNELSINPSYWEEKVVSESIYGEGINEFSIEKFRYNILCYVKIQLNMDESATIPEDIMNEISEILSAEDEYEAVTALRNFSSDIINFYDFWEYDCTEYTYHYLWCCYAIVWGIMQYDFAKDNCKNIEDIT